MVPSLNLLSCESPVSAKENPDRKKKKNGRFTNFWFMGSINLLVILESRTLKNFLPTLNALNNYLPQPLLQSPHYPSPYFQ